MGVGEANLGRWRSGIARAVAEAPGPGSSPFVLAEKRTNRPDILSSFKKYQGGWDIVNKHYWAVSVSRFTFHSYKIIRNCIFMTVWLCYIVLLYFTQ